MPPSPDAFNAAQVSTSAPPEPATATPPLPPGTAVALPVASEVGPASVTLTVDEDAGDSTVADTVSLHLPSWLVSMAVHLALVLLLTLLTVAAGDLGGGSGELSVAIDPEAASGSVDELSGESLESSAALETTPIAEVDDALNTLSEMPEATNPIGLVRPDMSAIDGALTPAEGGDGIVGEGGSLEIRLDPGSRSALVRSGGGTAESEAAVERALFWLAEHQQADGSWSFEHQKSPKCQGACGQPGSVPGKIAATSLALLPFLGTGQTHKEGQYKKNIEGGLRYLVRTMQIQGDLGSLHELGGQMYGHGLAAIALSEAYGMTHDSWLREPAQAALNYISEAQDPNGGGWRYMPRQPGDTSVVGWQMMALRSGQLATLRVQQHTMRKAGYFLDHVQGDRGATYGYLGPERTRPATTAIGLLCRMYLGWKHEQLALQRGVHILGNLGPSTDKTPMRDNMYYNYYATQVMHHYGGYPWQRWNEVMRQYLIDTQETVGHQRGSWYFQGHDHGVGSGGRLYFTALACMTLEVYYRYMPLYRPGSVEEKKGARD